MKNVYSRRYGAQGRLPLGWFFCRASVLFHREDTAHADRATSNLSLIHGGHFNHVLVGPCTDKRQPIVTFRISCMKLMAGYGNWKFGTLALRYYTSTFKYQRANNRNRQHFSTGKRWHGGLRPFIYPLLGFARFANFVHAIDWDQQAFNTFSIRHVTL